MTDEPDEQESGFVADPLKRPAVAPKRRSGGTFGYVVIVMIGVGALGGLTISRTRAGAGEGGLIAPAAAATTRFVTPDPLPSDAAAPRLPSPGSAAPAPQFAIDNAIAMPPASASIFAPTIAARTGGVTIANRLSAPALVVDLGDAPGAGIAIKGGDKPMLANPALAGAAKPSDAGDTDQFVQRVAAKADAAQASRIGRLDSVITEGTMIGAALETAINSDLPGFARAVISRDVMSFDGTRLLIPRGSRVIGQYKSGVAMGASRVFVVWTRLIRPDGVSIQLASPGGDDLGRGGIGGKVDRHFLQRFGGSLLMSVVNGAIDAGIAAVSTGGVPVYINSVAQAGQAVTSAFKSSDIPPTIRAAQGASVKIFVARDLDFSGMEGAP